MDAVTLIVMAVVRGLAESTGTVQGSAKDLYDLFMSRLRNKLANHEDAKAALVSLEKKPDSEARQTMLKEELTAVQAGKDNQLVELAQELLLKLDTPGSQVGKYTITISGGQGFVIGDHTKVEQHFESKPKH